MEHAPLSLMVALTLSFVAIGLLTIVFEVPPILIVIIFMAAYAAHLEYRLRSKDET
jgi:uncharacterized membrane protein YjjB (DUF3815 family)